MFIQLIGVVGVIVFISFLFLGFNIFFRKKKFPDFHVGHNKDMQKLGIKCAKHEFMTEYYKDKKKKNKSERYSYYSFINNRWIWLLVSMGSGFRVFGFRVVINLKKLKNDTSTFHYYYIIRTSFSGFWN